MFGDLLGLHGIGQGKNNGVVTITPSNVDQPIPSGNIAEGSKVLGDPDLVEANIAVNKNIFGRQGAYTADANAVAAEILSGKTAYVNGQKITGSMPSNNAQIITPSTVNQAIPSGSHPSGGYVVGDSNLQGPNILRGASIFGIPGEAKRQLSGSFTGAVNGIVTISGLGFIPKVAYAINVSRDNFRGIGFYNDRTSSYTYENLNLNIGSIQNGQFDIGNVYIGDNYVWYASE